MIRAVFKSGFLQATGFGAGFVLHILLAQMLGAAEYGLYSFVFSLSSILAMFAMFGLPQSVIRLIRECLESGDNGLLKGLIIFARAWPVLIGLLLGMSAYAGLVSLQIITQPEILIAGIALVPLIALLRVQSGVLRGFQKTVMSVFYELSYREVVFALVLLGGVLVLTAEQALLLIVIIMALGVLVAAIHVALVAVPEFKNARARYDTKRWLSLSFPMMMTVATRMLMVRTDLIILGFMVSSFDLGIYAAAAKFAMMMALAQMAVMPFFAPKATQFYQSGRQNDLRQLFLKARNIQALGGLILLVAFFIGGPSLLGFLGPDFTAGYAVFLILIIGQFIAVASGPSSALLEMSAYEKTAMKIVMVCALLNLILTPVLIMQIGIEGAALATSLAFVAQNIAAYVMVVRKGLLRDGT